MEIIEPLTVVRGSMRLFSAGKTAVENPQNSLRNLTCERLKSDIATA